MVEIIRVPVSEETLVEELLVRAGLKPRKYIGVSKDSPGANYL